MLEQDTLLGKSISSDSKGTQFSPILLSNKKGQAALCGEQGAGVGGREAGGRE